MNCKPGDLAIIVGSDGVFEDRWLGRIIRVTHHSGFGMNGAFCWAYEGPRLVHPLYGEVQGFADIYLRAIRPAGDDEPTQETRELPKDREIVEFGADAAAMRREMGLPA